MTKLRELIPDEVVHKFMREHERIVLNLRNTDALISLRSRTLGYGTGGFIRRVDNLIKRYARVYAP